MNTTERVKQIIDKQHQKGLRKYGKTVDDASLSTIEWINHAQEEAADLMVYLEKVKERSQDMRSVGQIEKDVLKEAVNRLDDMVSYLFDAKLKSTYGPGLLQALSELHLMIDETEA